MQEVQGLNSSFNLDTYRDLLDRLQMSRLNTVRREEDDELFANVQQINL